MWTTSAQRAFEQLKQALTTPPVLAMPSEEGEFCLDTDASKKIDRSSVVPVSKWSGKGHSLR